MTPATLTGLKSLAPPPRSERAEIKATGSGRECTPFENIEPAHAGSYDRKCMNEKPKSIWTKPRRGMRSYLLAWLAVLTIAPVIFAIFALATQTPFTHAEFGLLLFFEVFMSVLFLLGVFMQWLISMGWRRILFALACFATLIALAYA